MKLSKKKYQIFISSTYTDLIEERQAAVEAIIKMGHIPAGMELFKAGKSQWQTITKWIDESDIYVLILGGRYGSINPSEGKSYTHLEYEYALSQGKPAFALVLEDKFINKKENKNPKLLEEVNREKYIEFKELVKTKIVKFIEDIKDIKIELTENVRNLEETCHLEGWSKVGNAEEGLKYLEKILKLTEENQKLKAKITLLENKIQKNSKEIRFINDLTYEELKNILIKETVKIPEEIEKREKVKEITLLRGFESCSEHFSTGFRQNYNMTPDEKFLSNVGSKLISYKLAEVKKEKVSSAYFSFIYLTEDGKKFYTLLKKEKIK